jgi:hypothetical protein
MADDIDPKNLQLSHSDNEEDNSGFMSASSSATTIIEKFNGLNINAWMSSLNSHKRHASGQFPLIERDGKVSQFSLNEGNSITKKAQLSAHMTFLENCAQTGNPPRSLQ